MNKDPLRIALFGGTFDPVHHGHVVMACAAREALALDRVVMIPCALSPHKSDGPPPTSGKCRMDMLRIASAGYPWMELDACELEREGVSFSWQTAEDFRERFPDARLFWILGQDQWQVLSKWDQPERLAGLVEFIVFGRSDGNPAMREGVAATFLPEVHGASATQIRNALREGVVPDDGHPWMDPGVLDYIRLRGLYGTGQ